MDDITDQTAITMTLSVRRWGAVHAAIQLAMWTLHRSRRDPDSAALVAELEEISAELFRQATGHDDA